MRRLSGLVAVLVSAQAPPDQTPGVDGAVLLLAVATVGGVVGFLMILRRERRKKQARRR